MPKTLCWMGCVRKGLYAPPIFSRQKMSNGVKTIVYYTSDCAHSINELFIGRDNKEQKNSLKPKRLKSK